MARSVVHRGVGSVYMGYYWGLFWLGLGMGLIIAAGLVLGPPPP